MGFEVTPISSAMANAYLLTGARVALVDTQGGSGYRRIEKALRRKGLSVGDIDFILITHHHHDHVAAAAALKEASGATVIAGEKDAGVIDGSAEPGGPSRLSLPGKLLGRLPASVVDRYQSYRRLPVDRLVTDGDVIEELGLEVIAVPGHTAGGVCYFDRTGRRAFTGDIVSNIMGRTGMPVLSFSYSIEEILDSLDRLARLGLEEVYPGHGAVIRAGAAGRISSLVDRKRN